jgi:uncharacterized membrane protein YphA (DoxX/SURF4 family)
MKIITWICRILVGLTFIFSGFVKADDPLGFSYKLNEYLEVFHLNFLLPTTLFAAIFLIVMELTLGVVTLFGIFMKQTAWWLLALMIFFLFLTAYSYLANNITDCGCFGDAIKMSNAQTFWKDVILLILILPLFINRNKIHSAFSQNGNVTVFLIAILLSFGFTYHCYSHLPLIDFRAYKVGNNLRTEMSVPPNAQADLYQAILVYKNKKTGQLEKYTSPNYPWNDSAWAANHEFVKSENKLIKAGYHPAITDFQLSDDSGNDVTSKILDNPDYNFWVVCYDLSETDESTFQKIKQLAATCKAKNISIIGLTASAKSEVDNFKVKSDIDIPFYYCDGTVLKTIIRSNPGIVLLKNATVLGQWHHNDTPGPEEVEKLIK